MNNGQAQEKAIRQITPTVPMQGKVQALPVKAVTETTVSGLQTSMGDKELSQHTASHEISDLIRQWVMDYPWEKTPSLPVFMKTSL